MKSLQESGPKQAIIPIIHATPAMNPGILETVSRNADAIIFVVFANGGSPSNLNATIKKITDSGIPIFFIADKHFILKEKMGPVHGTTRIFDQTQVESGEAGAIPLEKANLTNLGAVEIKIQEEFKKGKRGIELGKALQEHFKYKEGEVQPIPAWEDPKRRIDGNKHIYE